MCQVHAPVHTSPYSHLEKPTFSIATQSRLPRIYYTYYLSLRIRTTGVSQLEKRNKEKKRRQRKGKKREGKRNKNEKSKKREEKTRKARKDKTRKGSKARKKEEEQKRKRKRKENVVLADSRYSLRAELG